MGKRLRACYLKRGREEEAGGHLPNKTFKNVVAALLYAASNSVQFFATHVWENVECPRCRPPVALSAVTLSSSSAAADSGSVGNAFARSASAVVRGGEERREGDILAEGHKFRN